MFSSKSKAESTAAQAWDYLTAAMAAAGDTAKDTGDKAAKIAGKASDQGHKLAGKKPGTPWGLIIGVGLLGVAIGWAAASSARAALERQAEQEELELAETAVVVTPTYDD